MRWDWLVYDHLSYRVSDRTYLWEIPASRPARSLTCPPPHSHRALGQRAPKPTIRSWLEGGVAVHPPPIPPHWTPT